MKILFSIIVTVQLLLIPYSEGFTCDPDVDCNGVPAGTLVPDTNCHYYYFCLGDGQHSPIIECDDMGEKGEVCTNEKECEDDWCTITTPDTCLISCNATGVENIPFPGDCSQYYACDDPTHTPRSCTDDFPYFNGIDCVEDGTQCCTVCQPHCDTGHFSLVVDPQNCNGYIICLQNGTAVKEDCIDGHYDMFEEECVKGEQCISYCSSESGSTLSTPKPEPGDSTVDPSPSSIPPTTIKPGSSDSTVDPSGGHTEEQTTPTTSIPSNNCYEEFVCPVDFGEFVYCDACISKHYSCSTGCAQWAYCSDGELFDYTISDCVPSEQCPTFSRSFN